MLLCLKLWQTVWERTVPLHQQFKMVSLLLIFIFSHVFCPLRPLLFIWTLHESLYSLTYCDSLLKTSRTPSQNHIPAPHNSPSPSSFPRRILLSNEHNKRPVNNLEHWKFFRTGRLQGEEELMAHICRVTQQEGKLRRPLNVTRLRFSKRPVKVSRWARTETRGSCVVPSLISWMFALLMDSPYNFYRMIGLWCSLIGLNENLMRAC